VRALTKRSSPQALYLDACDLKSTLQRVIKKAHNGFGRPVDRVEVGELQPKTTLILHYGHEKERLERDGLLGD
jgi:hypothetical protein